MMNMIGSVWCDIESHSIVDLIIKYFYSESENRYDDNLIVPCTFVDVVIVTDAPSLLVPLPISQFNSKGVEVQKFRFLNF